MPLLVRGTVLAAIEFDREAGFAAIKIEDVRAERMVAPELICAESAVAQPAPDEFFCPGLLLPQSACAQYLGHGWTVERVRREEKNGVTPALIPALSPLEKENHLPPLAWKGRVALACIL